MLNKKNIQKQLTALGLTNDESKIYLELLKKPNTHLQLSRITGVERAKIYRLANDLERRSLISKRTDDRGSFLVACDPKTLEVDLITQEERLKEKRNLLTELLPILSTLPARDTSDFVVNTYEGEEGIKQQLWHELGRKSEMVIFGGGVLEELIGDKKWVEKHRENTAKSKYALRELLNFVPEFITKHTDYFAIYSFRQIPETLLKLDNPFAVYDNTISFYHRHKGQQVGVEIVNASFAYLMKQMFEHYWQQATPISF